jgi:hypothetical protein
MKESKMIIDRLKNPSAEDIEQHFSAAMDSVNLIIELNKKSELSDTEKDMLSRNKEHLKIMISREWFTSEQKAILESVLQS